MSAIGLRLLHDPGLPVDMTGILPTGLAGRAETEIAARPVLVGNRRVPLGELFGISTGDEPRLVLEGSSRWLDHLGAGMQDGSLEIEGDAGAYLGRGLIGGRLNLTGSAGDFAGAAMSGGVLTIASDTGDFLAAAMAGEAHGMEGGTILVGGSAADRVGDRMRRGVIAVGGSAGAWVGSRLIGGTVLVGGSCGLWPGYGLRRGTLYLAAAPDGAPPLFADTGEHDLPWLALLDRHLQDLGWRGVRPARRVRRLTGDVTVGGRGELLLAG